MSVARIRGTAFGATQGSNPIRGEDTHIKKSDRTEQKTKAQ